MVGPTLLPSLDLNHRHGVRCANMAGSSLRARIEVDDHHEDRTGVRREGPEEGLQRLDTAGGSTDDHHLRVIAVRPRTRAADFYVGHPIAPYAES